MSVGEARAASSLKELLSGTAAVDEKMKCYHLLRDPDDRDAMERLDLIYRIKNPVTRAY